MRHRWTLATLVWLVACNNVGGPPIQAPPQPVNTAPPPPAVKTTAFVASKATAVIYDLAGARIGTATFADTQNGLLVSGTVSGLGRGAHGVHIHSIGKCESPFVTAGGHFNPDRKNHGFKNREGPHRGDLPNIDMPAAGTLKFEFLMPGITVSSTNPLVGGDGSAIVFHTSGDDHISDPEGMSGSRLACGVIRKI